MRKSWLQRFGLSLAAALVASGSVAAASDFVVALPNGYYITRGKSSEPMVVKRSGGTVVPGPVATYTVVRDIVTGHVPPPESAPDGKPAKRSSKAKPGYFILQTRTGELSAGLAEDAWKESLKSLGIENAPSLTAPVLPE